MDMSASLDDIDLILTDADGFNDDGILMGRIEYAYDIGCRCGESAQVTSSRHAANVDARIDAQAPASEFDLRGWRRR